RTALHTVEELFNEHIGIDLFQKRKIHPINASCRKRIQEAIVKAFNEEFEHSKQPGYKPVELDDDGLSHSDH
ncbi:MAG: hypothetical protein ACYSOT_05790, partial [Planctomycetota bacterium]